MKTKSLQIAFFLSAFNIKDIVQGFKIYNDGIESGLSKQGWKEQEEKPIDREFFELAGKYWIQDKPKPVLQSKNKNDILNDSTSLIQANSISSPKEKKEKGLIKKFFEFVKVSIGPKVVESVFQKRYSICKACKFHIVKGEKIFCKPCGCPTWEPAQLENKLRFARLSCPKEFFKAIDETTQKELLL